SRLGSEVYETRHSLVEQVRQAQEEEAECDRRERGFEARRDSALHTSPG
ncbi:hypothetical protein KIPB_001302, partial [Kipferlia bialata]